MTESNIRRFKISIKGYRVIVYSVVLLCLFSCYPYVFPQFLPIPSVNIMGFIDLFLLSLVAFGTIRVGLLKPIVTQLFLLQLIAWILFFFIHYDKTYFTRIFFLITTYLSLVLLEKDRDGILGFSKFYNNIILIMAIGGTCVFFCVLFFNFQPLFEFQNMDTRTAYCYGLTCSNALFGNVVRYAGYFDEPGAMAFWGVYALIINRLFIFNKQFENILLVCLLFTFSLAYYIQLFFFLIFFKIKSTKAYILLISSIILVSTAILSLKDTDYGKIYEFTFERLEFDENSGSIKGDNRSDLADTAKKYFFSSPFVGHGPGLIMEVSNMADNPYENLATDGIIGTLIMYAPLIAVWLICKERKYRFAVVILLLGYLQRPFHPNFIHPFTLYLFVVLSIYKYKLFCVK